MAVDQHTITTLERCDVSTLEDCTSHRMSTQARLGAYLRPAKAWQLWLQCHACMAEPDAGAPNRASLAERTRYLELHTRTGKKVRVPEWSTPPVLNAHLAGNVRCTIFDWL